MSVAITHAFQEVRSCLQAQLLKTMSGDADDEEQNSAEIGEEVNRHATCWLEFPRVRF